MNLDRHLLDVIVCPACRQSLAADENFLTLHEMIYFGRP